MSLLATPRWFLLVLTAVAMQVILLLGDVVFVTHYSLMSKPGLGQQAYSAFALETAGAFVFCFAPPVVYLICRWLCRKAGRAPLLHAGLLVALYYVMDILVVLVFGGMTAGQVLPYLLNGTAMLAAALLAGWHVRAGDPACR